MAREHNNVDVRQSREYREERTGEDRGNRDRARGRGALVNYYDDLGFATSKEAYQGWKENEAQWNEKKGAALSQLSDASSKLAEEEEKYKGYMGLIDKEMEKLGSVSSIVNKGYNDYVGNSGNWLTFNIYKGVKGNAGDKLETVKVLKDAGQGFIRALSGMEHGPSISGNNIYLNVLARNRSGPGGGLLGKDRGSGDASDPDPGPDSVGGRPEQKLNAIKDIASSTTNFFKDSYYKTNTPIVEKQLSETRSQLIAADKNITNALNQIAIKKDEIKAANYTIEQTEKLRQDALNTLREKFQKRAEAIKAYFAGSKNQNQEE